MEGDARELRLGGLRFFFFKQKTAYEINVRLKGDVDERILRMQALGPARGTQRVYSATMPAGLSGPVAIDLVGQASSVLVLRVAPKADALRSLTDRREIGRASCRERG